MYSHHTGTGSRLEFVVGGKFKSRAEVWLERAGVMGGKFKSWTHVWLNRAEVMGDGSKTVAEWAPEVWRGQRTTRKVLINTHVNKK